MFGLAFGVLGMLGCSDEGSAREGGPDRPDATEPEAADAGRILIDARVPFDATFVGGEAGQEGGTVSTDAGTVDSAIPPPTGLTIGTQRVEITGANDRALPVQLWYPTLPSGPAEGRAVSEFEPPGSRRIQLEGLLANAPEGCTNRTMYAADAPPPRSQGAPFPLIVMSHCHSGMRYGLFSVAEQLVDAGFVVAAVDHVGDTLLDSIAGTPGALSPEQLELRRGDITALLDVMLDANAAEVPEGLRGKLDAKHVGMLGHSFGSITSGRVTWSDPRIAAVVFIAAPPTFPLLSPTVLAEFEVPALFFYATEDNSLPSFINDIIISDYADYPREAWLARFTDAGHFAFSDLVGITPELSAGCGSGLRQTQPLVPFDYLDPRFTREHAARYARAFFERTLLAAPGLALDHTPPSEVTLENHP
jgi:dienelactone hydrolase